MKNSEKIILDLCGGTGAWSKPYTESGYDVRVITLPKYDVTATFLESNFMVFTKVRAYSKHDMPKIYYKDVYGVLAAPPCTMFSRARTRAKTPRDLKGGMVVVRACLDIIWKIQEVQGLPDLKFWALENPMGVLRRFLGRPKFTYNPYEYGDPWTKKTDIWGWFNEPRKKQLRLNESQATLCKNNNRKLPSISDFTGSKQSSRRAITPPGFAKAFFKANQ
jgi:site-specific DNA-cytosine methylase